jgi:protein involved in ribonucleotide reduction
MKMATTYELKGLKSESAKIFVSTIAGKKTRISVVDNKDAINYTQGNVLFQKTYSSWNRIPDSDVAEIKDIFGVVEADIE